jgi:hypothetical protein
MATAVLKSDYCRSLSDQSSPAKHATVGRLRMSLVGAQRVKIRAKAMARSSQCSPQKRLFFWCTVPIALQQ